ncbi:recombination-associated protein RdgC [Pseudomonas sp. UMAB-40]|uniref:recombination-associated protein RdgC n=1 Tax=Pseudomonas sp. UMAB-40 TaxID=1365407 RepID=UPI00214BF7AC|nr:recombination-associated protein RdgC [Pseudomonas sp. UMAB-40]
MTWFRKLSMYRITGAANFEIETLEAAMATKPARKLADLEMKHYGFASPLPAQDGVESTILAHPVAGAILVSAVCNFRQIPGDAVKDELNSRIAVIEREQSRKVRGKERADLKDLVIQHLMPRVLPKQKRTTALILPAQNLILVNTTKAADAEDLLSSLREVMGSLPVRPLTTVDAPSAVMTGWLRDKESMPENFFTLGDALLVGDEKSRAQLKDMDMAGEEVLMHLTSGMSVSNLLLAFGDQFSYRLSDKLQIEQIRFEDVIMQDAKTSAGDDVSQTFDASLTIMIGTFTKFIGELTQAFGGEPDHQSI